MVTILQRYTTITSQRVVLTVRGTYYQRTQTVEEVSKSAVASEIRLLKREIEITASSNTPARGQRWPRR